MSREQKINITPLKLETIKVKVIGKSPYLPEPMDEGVLDLYDKKKSKQTYTKDNRSELEKVKKKYYFTTDGKKGIPSRAFYNSMIRASSYLIDKSDGGMRNVREGVIIHGDILPLEYGHEEVLEHWGRQSGRTRAPRKILRNAFHDWSVILTIQYNSNQLSAEQIFHILNWAGFHVGVGGFRKEKSGNYGTFQIET